jgi:hypothetical protein
VGNEVTERQQAGVTSTEDPVDGEDGLPVADIGVLELAVARADDTSRDGVQASACGGVVARRNRPVTAAISTAAAPATTRASLFIVPPRPLLVPAAAVPAATTRVAPD